MELIFNEETHQYFLGDKKLISVTTLLQKHGLSPSYANINKKVLNAKAERGKIIHEELSNYILRQEIGFTAELQQFIEICSIENIRPLKSEFKVYNNEIAGTVDLSGIRKEKTFLGDFKTTATLHLQAIAWQLSLYEYLIGETFDELLVFYFTPKGLSVLPIERIDRAEIEKLLECERNGTIYQSKQLQIAPDKQEVLLQIQQELKSLEQQQDLLKKRQSEINEQIMQAMEKSQIKSFENDYFKITYVDLGTRETIDSAKLRAEMPEIAKKFIKVSNVKPSLRITLKEN